MPNPYNLNIAYCREITSDISLIANIDFDELGNKSYYIALSIYTKTTPTPSPRHCEAA